MKKKIFNVMLAVALICCAFSMFGCTNSQPSTEMSLVMNKRYILENDVRKDAEEQSYYIFYSDGTAKHVFAVYREIMYLKYTYVDDDKSAVVCFFDYMENFDGELVTDAFTGYTELITVSKNVLSTVSTYGYTFWINEDYLKEIPNFRK